MQINGHPAGDVNICCGDPLPLLALTSPEVFDNKRKWSPGMAESLTAVILGNHRP